MAGRGWLRSRQAGPSAHVRKWSISTVITRRSPRQETGVKRTKIAQLLASAELTRRRAQIVCLNKMCALDKIEFADEASGVKLGFAKPTLRVGTAMAQMWPLVFERFAMRSLIFLPNSRWESSGVDLAWKDAGLDTETS